MSVAGGWIGGLNGMRSSSVSADAYSNIIFSIYKVKKEGPKPPNSSPNCTSGSGALAGVTTGVGIASAGAFLGFPAGIPFLLAGIGIGIWTGVNQGDCK